MIKQKEFIEQLWDKFVKETEYITLDNTLPLRTVALDFNNFVLGELKKGGYISEEY